MEGLIMDRDEEKENDEKDGNEGVEKEVEGLMRILKIKRRRGKVYVKEEMIKEIGVKRDMII